MITLKLAKNLVLSTRQSLFEDRSRLSKSVFPQILSARRFKWENGEASEDRSSYRVHHMTYPLYAIYFKLNSLLLTRMLCAFRL